VRQLTLRRKVAAAPIARGPDLDQGPCPAEPQYS
jgi:hypothetical protein